MNKKPLDFTYRIIIFFLILLLGGCSTAKKKPVSLSVPEKQVTVGTKEYRVVKQNIAVKQESKKKFRDDVLVFRDLWQVDLDNDGTKDIVAVYTTHSNLGGVKVIKIIDEKTGKIIFKHTFNTQNIKLRRSKGNPLIIIKEKDYLFGLGLNRVYHWDGKALFYVRKVIGL